jgi:hypothetical protein
MAQPFQLLDTWAKLQRRHLRFHHNQYVYRLTKVQQRFTEKCIFFAATSFASCDVRVLLVELLCSRPTRVSTVSPRIISSAERNLLISGILMLPTHKKSMFNSIP